MLGKSSVLTSILANDRLKVTGYLGDILPTPQAFHQHCQLLSQLSLSAKALCIDFVISLHVIAILIRDKVLCEQLSVGEALEHSIHKTCIAMVTQTQGTRSRQSVPSIRCVCGRVETRTVC